jgi:hypothetical protein
MRTSRQPHNDSIAPNLIERDFRRPEDKTRQPCAEELRRATGVMIQANRLTKRRF